MKVALQKVLPFLFLSLLLGCNGDEDLLAPKIGKSVPSFGGNSGVQAPSFWHSSLLPMTVAVSQDFDTNELLSFADMPDEWNQGTDFSPHLMWLDQNHKSETPQYSVLDSYRWDNEMGIYKSYRWFSNVSSFALAVTYTSGYRINAGTPSEYIELVHADVIVNYRDFKFSTTAESGTYDLPSVVLHELGHFVGLDHIYDSRAVMAPSLYPATKKHNLTELDLSALTQLYVPSSRNLSSMRTALPLRTDPGSSRAPHEEVVRVYELRADGSCHHYENGQFISSH